MPKVLVGMSGGVDSSVTAYLLKQQGFEVEGLSLILWEARNRSDFTTCCSLESTDSAVKTAAQLGINHASVDVRDEFAERVIGPFVDSYAKGQTPNPCILCNRYIKFPVLLREADKRGIEYIATGHYARTSALTPGGASFLKKGADPSKDQSYVLYMLRCAELDRLLLPLGSYLKTDVRAIARFLMLDAADRPESQEICFIEDRNYAGFVEKLCPSACTPGPIVDDEGNSLGTHNGICRYTVGQRRRLGIASPNPYYVTRVDAARNTICVGSLEDTQVKEMVVSDLNWMARPRAGSMRATVKVRSMMKDKPALIEVRDSAALVVFDEPQFAPAPGQSAVFYDGDAVIGGGTIKHL
jgi:tRNA-uridine 2-sulfurtransferase